MQFEVTEEQCLQAKLPHEILLVDLVAVHVLWFIAALGMFNSLPYPTLATPVMSASILGYILWRAGKVRRANEDWFVMCHWQIAARRSKIFIGMLGLLVTVSTLGWMGHTYLGMAKAQIFPFIGGIGLLPTMVTVLALIVMESDAMHQAKQGKLGLGIQEKFPNPGLKVIEE